MLFTLAPLPSCVRTSTGPQVDHSGFTVLELVVVPVFCVLLLIWTMNVRQWAGQNASRTGLWMIIPVSSQVAAVINLCVPSGIYAAHLRVQ